MKYVNFDDHVDRLRAKIYSGDKGRLRLHLLWSDLQEVLTHKGASLRVLDAGCGLGQLGLRLAQAGHDLTFCDVSERMLFEVREACKQGQIDRDPRFIHQEVTAWLGNEPSPSYDLILCHALLEWTQSPRDVVESLIAALTPGGRLSIAFYNRHSLVLTNLFKSNLRRAMNESIGGDGTGLTPISPLIAEEVMAWLQPHGLSTLIHSGIRTFSDYLCPGSPDHGYEQLLRAEQAFSRREPYRSMARYIHLIASRQDGMHTPVPPSPQ